MISNHWRPLLVCALSVLALAFPTAAIARFPGHPLRQLWCAPLSGDSICEWRGQVRVADEAAGVPLSEELLRRHQSRLIGSEGSRVLTGPNAIARLLFRNRARCSLGGHGQAGEYFAHSGEERLFGQYVGYSSCTSLRGDRTEAGILCSPEEKCPATMRWNGTYLVKTEAPATASLTDSYIRRARIVVCSGSVRVRDEEENTIAESGASGNGRWVIVVEETTSTTYAEEIGSPVTETRHSIRIEVSEHQPGRGACKATSIEEQEHNVTP